MVQQFRQAAMNVRTHSKSTMEMQRVALLKSLEYLYIEACGAKLALVATLIGAGIEALKDEVAAMNGVSRAASSSITISVRNFTTNRVLTDDEDVDDDDFVRDGSDADD